MTTDETQDPPPSTPETSPVVATLYLPKEKGNRFVKVIGKAGKYTFAWDDIRRSLLRDYTSAAQFQREQLDIHQNRANSIIVCAMLGSYSDPVAHAKEAVAELIGSGLKLALPTRRHALQEIAETVAAELRIMSGEPEPSPAAKEADENTRPEIEPAEPALPPIAHTREDLMKMPIADYYAYARGRGITDRNRARGIETMFTQAEQAAERSDAWRDAVTNEPALVEA